MNFDWYVPAPVRAVQLTSENMDELAAWISAQLGCRVHWSGFTALGEHAFCVSGLTTDEVTVPVGHWLIIKPVRLQMVGGESLDGLGIDTLTPEEFELAGYQITKPRS